MKPVRLVFLILPFFIITSYLLDFCAKASFALETLLLRSLSPDETLRGSLLTISPVAVIISGQYSVRKLIIISNFVKYISLFRIYASCTLRLSKVYAIST